MPAVRGMKSGSCHLKEQLCGGAVVGIFHGYYLGYLEKGEICGALMIIEKCILFNGNG